MIFKASVTAVVGADNSPFPVEEKEKFTIPETFYVAKKGDLELSCKACGTESALTPTTESGVGGKLIDYIYNHTAAERRALKKGGVPEKEVRKTQSGDAAKENDDNNDDDEVQWSTDASAEAARARRQRQIDISPSLLQLL